MARVMAPPVFCIMKGALAASKTPAFLAFTPIIPWPSMSAHHDRAAGQQQVKQQSLVRTSDTSNSESATVPQRLASDERQAEGAA